VGTSDDASDVLCASVHNASSIATADTGVGRFADLAMADVLSPQRRQELHEAHITVLSDVVPRVSPALRRRAIMLALSDDPTNPRALAAVVSFESRYRIAGRLRRYFDASMQRGTSPLVVLFAVRAELGRAGAHNRIRSLLERAVRTASCGGSAALWRLFILFETCNGCTDRAERVFFRAVQHCPQSKRLWIDCLHTLRTMLPPEQLRGLLRLLAEKELRLISDTASLESLSAGEAATGVDQTAQFLSAFLGRP